MLMLVTGPRGPRVIDVPPEMACLLHLIMGATVFVPPEDCEDVLFIKGPPIGEDVTEDELAKYEPELTEIDGTLVLKVPVSSEEYELIHSEKRQPTEVNFYMKPQFFRQIAEHDKPFRVEFTTITA